MMQHRTCPDCGANLDPEEKCDCGREIDTAENNGKNERR